MTVAELIAELQKMPPAADVVVTKGDDYIEPVDCDVEYADLYANGKVYLS